MPDTEIDTLFAQRLIQPAKTAHHMYIAAARHACALQSDEEPTPDHTDQGDMAIGPDEAMGDPWVEEPEGVAVDTADMGVGAAVDTADMGVGVAVDTADMGVGAA